MKRKVKMNRCVWAVGLLFGHLWVNARLFARLFIGVVLKSACVSVGRDGQKLYASEIYI